MKKLMSLVLALVIMMMALGALAEDVTTYTGFVTARGDNHSYLETIAFKSTLEKAGIRLEVDNIPGSMVEEKRNVLLNGGEYPDFFMAADVDVEWYGAQEGILLPLEDLIREYAPNLTAYIDSVDAWDFLECTDGHVYGVPHFGEALNRDEVLWVNKVWLENLDLEMPKSLEDVKDVLVAFKEMDANGNGDTEDEIPLMSADADFIHFFNYYDWRFNYEFRLIVRDDGNVDFLPLTQEFYDLTEYCADLYQEGLINEDCFTLSSDAGAALAQTSDTVGMFFSTSGTNVISGEKLMDYCVVEPWCNSVEVSNGIMRNTFVITNACEEPEKLISWLDYFFTEEGSLLVTLGVQGETYDIDENGNWYYIETADQTADFIQGVLTANGGIPTYESAFKLYQDAGSDPISAYSNTQRAIASKHAGLKMLELNFTDEDLQIGLPIMIDVNTYFPQYMASVMTGEMDLDDSWEEFQSTLQAMQAPVLEDVLQGCYDRVGE